MLTSISKGEHWWRGTQEQRPLPLSPSHVNSRSYLGQPAVRKIVVDTGGGSGPEQTLSASRSGGRPRRTPGGHLHRRTATSPQRRRVPRRASAGTFFSWPARLLQKIGTVRCDPKFTKTKDRCGTRLGTFFRRPQLNMGQGAEPVETGFRSRFTGPADLAPVQC